MPQDNTEQYTACDKITAWLGGTGWGLLLEDLRKLLGHGAGLPALCGPAWAGLGSDDFRKSLPVSTML